MTKKNILSLLLAVIMVIGMIPATAFATDPNYVAKNTTTDNMYETLFEAIEAATDGEKIQLMDDYTIETAEYTVYKMPKGSTLDLNGKTLTIPFATAMFAGENFTIKNGTLTPPSDKNQDYALFIGNAVNSTDERVKTSATVENVDVVKGGINVRYGAEATIRDCNVTVNPNRKYYAVYAEVDSKVTVENGSYTGGRKNIDVYAAENATLEVLGGIFTNEVNDEYLPEGYVLEENGDGTYTVLNTNFVAEVGGTEYLTLLEAVNAAKPGDTISLVDDCAIALDGETYDDRTITLPDGVTIELDGHTLTVPFQKALFAGNNITIQNGTLTTGALENYVLYIMNGSFAVKNVISTNGINVQAGTVTLENVDATCPNKYYAVYAGEEADVTINSGNYTTVRNANNLYADGKITVYGGTFTKNLKAAENATLKVLGGRFKNDPSKYVPFGYGVTQDAGYYTVTETPNARQFIVAADVADVRAGEPVTITVQLEGKNLVGAEWILTYEADKFTYTGEGAVVEGNVGKISGELKSESAFDTTILNEYTFTTNALTPEQIELDSVGTFAIDDQSIAWDVYESATDVITAADFANASKDVKIELLTFTETITVNGVTVTDDQLYNYDPAKQYEVVIKGIDDSLVETRVKVNGEYDDAASLTFAEYGEYEIEYTITKAGYITVEGTFKITIEKPAYIVEVNLDDSNIDISNYIAGKRLVIVHTDTANIHFEYDGKTMIDVCSLDYTYVDHNGLGNAAKDYTYEYAIVVDNIENGDLAAYEAKITWHKGSLETENILTFNELYEYDAFDLNFVNGLNARDVTFGYGVRRGEDLYYTDYMKSVLKTDIYRDKCINDNDMGLLKEAYDNWKKAN